MKTNSKAGYALMRAMYFAHKSVWHESRGNEREADVFGACSREWMASTRLFDR